ncbi:ribose 5-phosphate isomerase B [Puteibacter caeruleilacunae]|nr:ribose 5-phosphate isomerase B [Puteibacter caeruleilacunae]
MEKRCIGIACDHAGYQMKKEVVQYLESKGFKISDFGCDSDESCDYPDFAHPMASAVEKGECDLGISICGSGNGINMTVNKHQGIRSALCWEVELAELAVEHNNANVLAVPSRFISIELAIKIVDAFLNSEFEGGRHERRINKIPL